MQGLYQKQYVCAILMRVLLTEVRISTVLIVIVIIARVTMLEIIELLVILEISIVRTKSSKHSVGYN